MAISFYETTDTISSENQQKMIQLAQLIADYEALTKIMYPEKDARHHEITSKISSAYGDLKKAYNDLQVELARNFETGKDFNQALTNIFKEVLNLKEERKKFMTYLAELEEFVGVTKKQEDQPAAR